MRAEATARPAIGLRFLMFFPAKVKVPGLSLQSLLVQQVQQAKQAAWASLGFKGSPRVRACFRRAGVAGVALGYLFASAGADA